MRGLHEETRRDHIRFVWSFAAFLRRPPDKATPEDIRRFQVHQAESSGEPPTINCSVSALRFLITVTLDRADLSHRSVLVPHPRGPPTVLSVEEVGRPLELAPVPPAALVAITWKLYSVERASPVTSTEVPATAHRFRFPPSP